MRNSDWNSNSWVNKINGTPKAVDKQSDWGYTFGGPIGKPGGNNKLFFFYAHEYRPRNAANVLRQFRVPTAGRAGRGLLGSLDNNGAAIPALRDGVAGGTFAGNQHSAGPALPDRPQHPEAVSAAQYPAGAGDVLQPGVPLADVQDAQPAAGVSRRLPASSALRFTAKYTGQRGFRGTTPGTDPGFNDTFGAYPWVHAFATTVNYTINPTTFLEGTYGYSNRRLGGIVNSDSTFRFNTGLQGLPKLFPERQHPA